MIKIKTDVKRAVTKPQNVTIVRKGGRPKVHGSNADRQRAYRSRRKGA